MRITSINIIPFRFQEVTHKVYHSPLGTCTLPVWGSTSFVLSFRSLDFCTAYMLVGIISLISSRFSIDPSFKTALTSDLCPQCVG